MGFPRVIRRRSFFREWLRLRSSGAGDVIYFRKNQPRCFPGEAFGFCLF